MGAPWRPRGPDDLDEDQRARIRYQVLSSLRGRASTPLDRAYDTIAVLAVPAPHLVRAIVAVALVAAIVASATVASVDALPDEPLYDVKIATEGLRLHLALGAEDRAVVELSMAEHRLAEAERLAESGRAPEALVAASTYGVHLANAAAELATVDAADPRARAVADELRQLLAQQQERATEAATHLAADPRVASVAPVFRAVASVPPLPEGEPTTEGIARHAAAVTEQLVGVAARLESPSPERPDLSPPPPASAVVGPEASAARAAEVRLPGAAAAAGPRAPEGARAGTVAPAPGARNAPPASPNALERTRHNAEKAAEAAQKAKHAREHAPAKRQGR